MSVHVAVPLLRKKQMASSSSAAITSIHPLPEGAVYTTLLYVMFWKERHSTVPVTVIAHAIIKYIYYIVKTHDIPIKTINRRTRCLGGRRVYLRGLSPRRADISLHLLSNRYWLGMTYPKQHRADTCFFFCFFFHTYLHYIALIIINPNMAT
jgi:hypothetical protein